MATFLEWYERTAPGSNPDFFAINSWAAADMLVRSLRAAGGAPTRDAVVAGLQAQTEYTGDGFMAPRNPAGQDHGQLLRHGRHRRRRLAPHRPCRRVHQLLMARSLESRGSA